MAFLLVLAGSGGAPVRLSSAQQGGGAPLRAQRAAGPHADEWARLSRETMQRARERLGMVVSSRPLVRVAPAGAFDGLRALPCGRVRGLFHRAPRARPEIVLFAPRDVPQAEAILAHEIAHLWQAEHCPNEQGTRVREGFAEWVAWKLLEGRPGGEAQRRLIRGRSDEYGRGFRLFAGLEAREGPAHVLWYARAARLRI